MNIKVVAIKFFNLFLLIILSLGVFGQEATELLSTDSITVDIIGDSIVVTDGDLTQEEEDVLDKEVEYDAVDSIFYDLSKNEVQLFGEAVVKYGDITLTAHQISYNFNSHSVTAVGGLDSAGNTMGNPTFQQQNEKFDAKKITYNFDSQKGYIEEVRTEISSAYVHAKVSKKQTNNQIHIKGGFITTCDKEKPHFGFRTTKMIVVPDDKVVAGPGYLVFFNVIPLPVILPFALIPDQNKKASGIIMPSYGDAKSTQQGFYLKDGGYYWAINDHFHTAIKGSIFANGSWGVKSDSKYMVKYKFNGNFSIDYKDYIIGDKDIDTGPRKSKSLLLKWSHSQDPKSSQYSSFSSSVNFQSGFGYREDVTSSDYNYINKNVGSNITYRYIIPNSPFNVSASAKLSQVIDPIDSVTVSTTNDFTLPQITFNMKRVDIPLAFLKKNKMSSKKWFEKIGVNYTLNAENRIKFNQQQLDTINLTRDNFQQYIDIKNGLKHNAALSTSFNVKTISISPSIRTRGNWYFQHIEKHLDPQELVEVTDTINEFSQVWDISGGINVTGKVYGMYAFKGDRWLKAMRHQITASAGVNYAPGTETDQFGYYGDDGDYINYNPYKGSIYSPPNSNPSNTYNFKLTNDLEAKVKDKTDSIADYKKVKFINNLIIESSFDALRDSIKWSDVRLGGRFTNLFDVLNINYTAVFDPYAYDNKGRKTNESWLNSTNNLIRVKTAAISANFSLRSKKKEKKVKPKNEAQQIIQEEYENDPGLFQDLNIPWDVNVSYNINLNSIPTSMIDSQLNDSLYFNKKLNHTLGIRGSFSIFQIFRFNVSTGYDFVNLDWALTTIGLYVDLHCWEFSAFVRPSGGRKSYSFSINIKSPLLKDLKIKKESTFGGGSGFF